MEPIIIDGCLPRMFFDNAVSRITEWEKIPYVFLNSSAYGGKYNDPYDYSFCHLVFDKGIVLSPLYDVLYDSLLIALDKMSVSIGRLIRIRIGLITAQTFNKKHEPHVDMTYSHKTLLLYLNDVDGPTTLYNQFYDPTKEEFIWTVQQLIEPVANRAVLFDGLQYHSSSTPTTHPYRLVVNYNFK